ncbi:MAG: WGR domain-containing protein [Planctomycetaceae bacterium]
MLDFRITLGARNPARRCSRHYRVEAGTDLFGVCVVEISYGRIGTAGRSRCYVLRDEEEARHLARSILKCRVGLYAVSASLVRGLPWRVYDNDARRWAPYEAREHAFSYFGELEPIDRVGIGYSILLYRVNEVDAARLARHWPVAKRGSVGRVEGNLASRGTGTYNNGSRGDRAARGVAARASWQEMGAR